MKPLVEIYINSGDTLDINTEFGIGVTYSIDDIKNIEKRNTAHSKTVKLPGTKKNNFLLGNLFDVNSDFTNFNPNKKTSAKIIRNGTVILDGFLQLRNITKNNEVDLEGTEIEYEVVLFDNQVDFYTIIENKNLDELDFSDFNHNFTKDGIVNSWSNTYKDVYTYPLLFNGNSDYTGGINEWDLQDFKPSIFHKAYLQQIGEEAGYEFGGDFYNKHSDYEKEIIPFNKQDNELKSTKPIFDSEFRAGLTNTNNVEVQSKYQTLISVDSFFQNNKRIIPFDNDSTSPNFDNNNNFYAGDINRQWDTTNNPAAFPFSLDGEFTVDVILSGIDRCRIFSTSNNYELGPNYTNVTVDMVYSLRRVSNNTQLGTEVRDVNIFNQQFPVELSPGQVVSATTSVTGFFLNNQIIQTGEKLRIVSQLDFVHPDNLVFFKYVPGLPQVYTTPGRVYLEVNIRKSGSTGNLTRLENHIEFTNNLLEFTEINLNSAIPLNIKQSDIITDLIRRYNLYLKIDPDNKKKLLLYTRNQFYSGGTTLDWTNKKDYSTPDIIQFLPELQTKKILFTYSKDSDTPNKDFEQKTQKIYGQKRIIFDNDFTKGEKKIETPFSPTPLIKNKNTNPCAIVPAILSRDPKNKIRVLYYAGLIKTIQNRNFTLKSSGGFITNNYTTYPYCGHFNDPFNPTLDINFGDTDFLYYRDTLSGTTNNLFNNYWKNEINQIAEGKLITSKFNLTETDINYIKDNMNSKIFVKDSYYFINKIIDYNPTQDKLTEVELLKILDGVEFVSEPKKQSVIITPGIDISKPTFVSMIKTRDSLIDNSNSSDDTVKVGPRNLIGSDSENTLIIGSGNTIDNKVKESGILGGNNNTIRSGVKNSWVIGTNNKTISKSSEFWIGNLHIVDGQVKPDYNLIQGGRDKLINRFSNSEINLVQGGKNELRALNVKYSYNLIQGGKDKV